jgi:hypothetical protein
MVSSAASHLQQATDGNGELMFLVTRSLVVPLRILSAVKNLVGFRSLGLNNAAFIISSRVTAGTPIPWLMPSKVMVRDLLSVHLCK